MGYLDIQKILSNQKVLTAQTESTKPKSAKSDDEQMFNTQPKASAEDTWNKLDTETTTKPKTLDSTASTRGGGQRRTKHQLVKVFQAPHKITIQMV